MKVAISTDQGYVSAHFGRCPSYTLFEISDGRINHKQEIPNPGHQPGFLPGYLSKRGVTKIIAGGMGPRAQRLFEKQNIETYIGVQGSVDDVINEFMNQELKRGEDLCEHRFYKRSSVEYSHPVEDAIPQKGKNICVTAQEKGLDSEVDPRFGRAEYFLIFNPDSVDAEAIENPNKEASQGAGIQSAQLVSDKDVSVVLTGRCGPNAKRILQSSGIKVITGISGNAEDAISHYMRDKE